MRRQIWTMLTVRLVSLARLVTIIRFILQSTLIRHIDREATISLYENLIEPTSVKL